VQYKFFTIPITHPNDSEQELNTFIGSHRVLVVQREFVSNGENSFWALAVEYLASSQDTSRQNNRKKTVDYREVLSTEDFALFSKLREWRKEVAEKEAVPVYTIFTNEQLAKIACNRVTGPKELQEIEGVGTSRIKKYAGILEVIQQAIGHET